MAVDLTLLLSELQKKAYLADSSQDTQDLFFLLKSTVRADQNPILEAANDGALLSIPSLERTPSTIYYNKESKNLYFAKNNEWVAIRNPDWFGTNGLFAYGGGINTEYDTIDYQPFANDTAQFTAIGSMTETISYMSAARDYSSKDASYIIAGYDFGPVGGISTIQKHANSTSATTASNVGNLSAPSYRSATVASTTDAYTHLSYSANPVAVVTTINKFAFGSTVTGVEVGDMLVAAGTNLGVTDAINQKGYLRRFSNTGVELEVFPFSSGVPFTTSLISPYGATLPVGIATAAFSNPTQGYLGTTASTGIEKFNFGNDTAVAFGNPTAPAASRMNSLGGGTSSETKGYHTGGYQNVPVICSYPFASEANTGVRTPGVASPHPNLNTETYSGGSHF